MKFLKVIPLRDGKAVTIKTALVKYLEENRVAIQNVAGFGSDGAACMIGKLVTSAISFKKILSVTCL